MYSSCSASFLTVITPKKVTDHKSGSNSSLFRRPCLGVTLRKTLLSYWFCFSLFLTNLRKFNVAKQCQKTNNFVNQKPQALAKLIPLLRQWKKEKVKSPLIWYYKQTIMAKCTNCIPFTHLATFLFARQDFRTRQNNRNTKSWDYCSLQPARNQCSYQSRLALISPCRQLT